MAIPAAPVKFVVYKSAAGFNSLAVKDEFTIYFVRETLRFYQGSYDYNSVIAVDTLPVEGIPLKIYLVDNTYVFLRSFTDWILLNPEIPEIPEGGSGVAGAEGISLNNKTIGGVKIKIEENDVLRIPEYWQYNVKNLLSLDGDIINNGEIYID